MYNFKKVGVWVQVRIWRCIKCGETKNYLLEMLICHFRCYDVIGHVTRTERIFKFV